MNWWRLGRRVHSSWLVAATSFGILFGAASSYYLAAGAGVFRSLSWLAIGCLLVIISLRWNYLFMLLVVTLAGGLIGVWRGSADQLERLEYKQFYGRDVTVQGEIKRDIDVDENGNFRLQLAGASVNGRSLKGTVWVSTQQAKDVLRGDRVEVSGPLREGFGSFSGVIYRASVKKIERPVPGDVAGRVRDEFANKVRQAIDEPEASLGLGYLVGQRRYLPPELDDSLRIAGLTHVVVASGFHLSTIVRFVRRILERVSRFMATAATSVVMLGFIAVTGLSPSMMRASLVTGLSLAAWYYGRKFHPLVLLPLVAAISVLVTPSYIWGSMGWQLSFAAFSGVMILAPLAQRYLFGEKKPGALRQMLGETMAAQIATWPILVYSFGQFSTLATVANILILPLVPLAMLGAFLVGIAQATLPVLAGGLALLADWLLGYMIGVVEYVAAVPFAVVEFDISLWQVALAYLLIVAACLYMKQRTKMNLRDTNIVD